MTFDWRREWPALLAIVATIAASVLLYPRLPETVPTHWNAAGVPDDYSSRAVGAFLVPGLMVGIYALLLVVPRIDPRRANVERFSETYALIRTGTVLFLAYIHGVTLYTILSGAERLNSALITSAVGLLFLLIGNYMPRMRSNWFMGIRTPWTLSSERVWRETHRLGGRTFMLAGLLLLLSPLFPPEWALGLLFLVITIAALLPIAYSYWAYRAER